MSEPKTAAPSKPAISFESFAAAVIPALIQSHREIAAPPPDTSWGCSLGLFNKVWIVWMTFRAMCEARAAVGDDHQAILDDLIARNREQSVIDQQAAREREAREKIAELAVAAERQKALEARMSLQAPAR